MGSIELSIELLLGATSERINRRQRETENLPAFISEMCYA
jgi:hypothetical protein